MTDTQHAQSLEEEVVSNDPVTDQEPAPDEPYGKLPQATAGVNPWRVQPETTAPEGRRGRGFLLPRMATRAGVIGHHMDWAQPGARGAMKLQGENPLSFTFINNSSLTAFGFWGTQARAPGQHHWFVPPYSQLTLGTTGPIAWTFDPAGSQYVAGNTAAADQTYIVQAYDLLLTPYLGAIQQAAATPIPLATGTASKTVVTGSGVFLGANLYPSATNTVRFLDGTSTAGAELAVTVVAQSAAGSQVSTPPGGIRFANGLYMELGSGATTEGTVFVRTP